jgi:ubiquinone/menaquinone biosynthesis C-methylase UbiE
MDVIDFARVEPDATVLEVGSGTGNFLSLFEGVASSCIGVDLTFGMLEEARRRYPSQLLVQGDGESLPLASASVDLATCAQMIHHVWDPLPLVKELRRVAGRGGRVLIVDQVATERFEEATRMSQLETVRDPSHAVSRPPSGYLTMVRAAGLEVIDERIFEDRSRFSKWMWSNEFDEERIDATRRFVEQHGHETGMGFEKDGDDYVFTRRRIMILAQRT